jgi:hypothetical protein
MTPRRFPPRPIRRFLFRTHCRAGTHWDQMSRSPASIGSRKTLRPPEGRGGADARYESRTQGARDGDGVEGAGGGGGYTGFVGYCECRETRRRAIHSGLARFTSGSQEKFPCVASVGSLSKIFFSRHARVHAKPLGKHEIIIRYKLLPHFSQPFTFR